MDDLELQQYLFDLQGYLVIENVLSQEEVATLTELLDRPEPLTTGGSQRFGSAAGGAPACPGFLDWGQPFCDLLDHPRIMPVLRFRLGDCFRLDRLYGIRMREGDPSGQLHSDYGASSSTAESVPGEYYAPRGNAIDNGFVVVAWSLSPSGPDQGGFCCIPGSHKGNYKLPEVISAAGEEAPCAVIPPVPAGSAILFTEALTHATATWRGTHERRSLLYKYCVAQMAWSTKRVQAPADFELTQRQRILLSEPGDPHRFFPSLFESPDSEEAAP
mgnify:CR=1 FL=1|jgi:ectoine hydroxylase-related dioxygenase (phytanoyl-CoA dioxygenase family)